MTNFETLYLLLCRTDLFASGFKRKTEQFSSDDPLFTFHLTHRFSWGVQGKDFTALRTGLARIWQPSTRGQSSSGGKALGYGYEGCGFEPRKVHSFYVGVTVAYGVGWWRV